jgi:hypothetical protein
MSSSTAAFSSLLLPPLPLPPTGIPPPAPVEEAGVIADPLTAAPLLLLLAAVIESALAAVARSAPAVLRGAAAPAAKRADSSSSAWSSLMDVSSSLDWLLLGFLERRGAPVLLPLPRGGAPAAAVAAAAVVAAAVAAAAIPACAPLLAVLPTLPLFLTVEDDGDDIGEWFGDSALSATELIPHSAPDDDKRFVVEASERRLTEPRFPGTTAVYVRKIAVNTEQREEKSAFCEH